MAAAREEKEEMAKGGGADFMKLGVGKSVVRILPPVAGSRSPFRVVHQHFVRLPTQPGPVVFVCPKMETRSPCPMCERAAKLKSSGNEADRDAAWELMPKRRVFCNVVDRAHPEDGPKVLAFGKLIHEELVSLRDDEDAGGDYTHPLTGFDIIIIREGTGKNDTAYKVRRSPKETPLSPDAAEMNGWAEVVVDLEQFARTKTYAEICELLGITPERDEAPKKALAAKATTAARGQRKAATAEGGKDDDDDMPY